MRLTLVAVKTSVDGIKPTGNGVIGPAIAETPSANETLLLSPHTDATQPD